MPTITELLTANLHDVFGNRDATARREAIERVYAEDVVFTDPDGAVTGWDALEAKAAGLVDDAPASFVFAEAGPAYLGSDTGALAWTFGPEGAPVAQGVDVIEVRAGRIVSLLTLIAG
ncbi:nuclear transport factor 2 family protein [Leifsonia sp. LS-T14]|uniref:nuclear transport factor 2 family protein n=1 Tax=unclassified Leifsonia TaxID=2663824 RepID=UPI0035A692BE